MMQNISTSSLTPDDAGTFTCTADGGSTTATSDSFILHVSCKLQQIVIYVTGFAKTQHNPTRTEIQFIA